MGKFKTWTSLPQAVNVQQESGNAQWGSLKAFFWYVDIEVLR